VNDADENRDADEVEHHSCPRCLVQAGSPCRSRSGAVAGTYHTGRFTKAGRLSKLLRVLTPADRGPGRPWRPGTPPPAPIGPDAPTADIRIGYSRCSTLTQELQSQLDALAGHGIPRDKIFSEKISTRVRVRPQFEAALALARQIKAHAPHCRVILTVYEMKRLGRDAAELTALADHLTAHGLVLEMLAGPLPGIYDPTGPGRILFGFLAAMAETERENIREASVYRALGEHAKTEAYPEAVEQAHAEFAELRRTDQPTTITRRRGPGTPVRQGRVTDPRRTSIHAGLANRPQRARAVAARAGGGDIAELLARAAPGTTPAKPASLWCTSPWTAAACCDRARASSWSPARSAQAARSRSRSASRWISVTAVARRTTMSSRGRESRR